MGNRDRKNHAETWLCRTMMRSIYLRSAAGLSVGRSNDHTPCIRSLFFARSPLAPMFQSNPGLIGCQRRSFGATETNLPLGPGMNGDQGR